MISASKDWTAVFAAIFLSISRRLRWSRAVRPWLTFTFYHEGAFFFLHTFDLPCFCHSSFLPPHPDFQAGVNRCFRFLAFIPKQKGFDLIMYILKSVLGRFVLRSFSLSGLQPRRWWVWSVAIQSLQPPLHLSAWHHGRANGDCTDLTSPLQWRCLHTRSVWI